MNEETRQFLNEHYKVISEHCKDIKKPNLRDIRYIEKLIDFVDKGLITKRDFDNEIMEMYEEKFCEVCEDCDAGGRGPIPWEDLD